MKILVRQIVYAYHYLEQEEIIYCIASEDSHSLLLSFVYLNIRKIEKPTVTLDEYEWKSCKLRNLSNKYVRKKLKKSRYLRDVNSFSKHKE